MKSMAKEWVLNSATNRFQLNFKRNVGATSEAIRKCAPKSLEEWQDYYFKNVKSEEHIIELGKKLYIKITEVLVAEIDEITEEDCINYIKELVIDRTYDGYVREIKTIYEQLQETLKIKIDPAPDAWDRLYNVDFFNQYGLEPSDDWTWEDLIENGKKVQAQNQDAHLLFLTNDVLMYVTRDIIKMKYGENMITDDFQLICTPEDLVECMRMVKDLIDSGTMPPFEESVPYETVFADQIPAWLEGRWGMTVLSASNLPSIIAASPFEVGTMAWVSGNGEYSATTIAPTMMLGIPKDNDYPEETAAFINWFMNDPEAISITGDSRGIPANAKAREQITEEGKIAPQVSAMLDEALMKGGTPENGNTLNAEIGAIISDYSHRVGYGVLTPEEAGYQLYDDLNHILEQQKK